MAQFDCGFCQRQFQDGKIGESATLVCLAGMPVRIITLSQMNGALFAEVSITPLFFTGLEDFE